MIFKKFCIIVVAIGLDFAYAEYDLQAMKFAIQSENTRDSKHCAGIFVKYEEKEKAIFPFIFCVNHAAYFGKKESICEPLKGDHGSYKAFDHQDKWGICLGIVAHLKKELSVCDSAGEGRAKSECINTFKRADIVDRWRHAEPYFSYEVN